MRQAIDQPDFERHPKRLQFNVYSSFHVHRMLTYRDVNVHFIDWSRIQVFVHNDHSELNFIAWLVHRFIALDKNGFTFRLHCERSLVNEIESILTSCDKFVISSVQ